MEVNFKELYNSVKVNDCAIITNIFIDYVNKKPCHVIQFMTNNYCIDLEEDGTYHIFEREV